MIAAHFLQSFRFVMMGAMGLTALSLVTFQCVELYHALMTMFHK
ncbi:hypothetical protein [Sinobaca sp. H24]|nr:hypothetical protein [Sinobaca sp. H24]